MNYQDKTKDELIKELRKFQREYDSLKTSYEKEIMESKRAEVALRKSEQRLNYHVNNSPLATIEWNSDFIVTRWSGEAKKIFGWNQSETIGKPIMDLQMIYDEDIPIVQKTMVRLTDGSSKYVVSANRNYTKDRKVIYCEWYNSVLLNPQGKMISVMSQVMDITERKQAEEALHHSEECYRNLFETASDSIFIVDRTTGKFIDANSAASRLYGYSTEEFLRLRTRDVSAEPEKTEAAVREGITQVPLRLHRRKDGTIFPVEIMSSYFTQGGRSMHTAFIRDIIVRKQMEEALRLEIENFRHSLDDSPLGVRIASKEGNTIYANKTILNFYGYDSLEELQKTPLKNRYTQESYAEAQKRKQQRERGDLSATDYEISIIRKNGEIRHLQVFRKEVLWDGVRQFQVICNDITERKQAEEEIRKSTKLMKDLHVHLNEIREEEHAMTSREIHDQIGQSLTALKLDLNWMHKYINTDPEAVAKIQGMIELVTGTIKAVQRISSELRPGILDDLGLAATIEWYCDEFEKRTSVRCDLNLDDSTVGDSQKNLVFFRVLQEALTNVIRHANASSVAVKLHHAQKGTTLTIHDNGIGIPEEKINSYKSLGLIGMRERVRQFGGKIDISSRKGQGTRLNVLIPEKKGICITVF